MAKFDNAQEGIHYHLDPILETVVTRHELNIRLHQICTDLQDQLGLIWRPLDGIDPQDMDTRGWYTKKSDGSWESVLSPDVELNEITLGGMNIWRDLHGILQMQETKNSYEQKIMEKQ
jgi:hypothetical protein